MVTPPHEGRCGLVGGRVAPHSASRVSGAACRAFLIFSVCGVIAHRKRVGGDGLPACATADRGALRVVIRRRPSGLWSPQNTSGGVWLALSLPEASCFTAARILRKPVATSSFDEYLNAAEIETLR